MTATATLAHYIAAERTAETVAEAFHATQANRHRGVSFGGMAPAPFVPRTDAQIRSAAQTKKARAEAMAASPEGRFQAAARLIWEATGDERLLNCASRGVIHEIDSARRLLSGMSGPAADQARAALADIASPALKAAA